MLGFDVDPLQTPRLLAEWKQYCRNSIEAEEIRQSEDEILNIFVNICSLFHHRREMEEPNGGEAPTSEAYLFAYLRMLDTSGEGQPPFFVDALRRALAHYGVCTLDRSPELEESLLWIYKSHQRVEQQIAPVLAVLERRLGSMEPLTARAEEPFRVLLDRMISITRGVFPAVSDMAREVRYRYFDQPLFERARNHVYAQVEEHLACLSANPEALDSRERVRALSDCPQPLAGLFSSRFAGASPALRELMLEILTARYYRIRNLLGFRHLEASGHRYLAAEYDHEEKRIHIFTTYAEYPLLEDAGRAIFPLIEAVPADHDIVIDLYLWHPGLLADPNATQREVHSMLNQIGFSRSIRRIVVAVAGPGGGYGMGGVQHFTYRDSGSAYEEEQFYRGLHPMVGKRLHSGGSITSRSSVCHPSRMFTSCMPWPTKILKTSACSPVRKCAI